MSLLHFISFTTAVLQYLNIVLGNKLQIFHFCRPRVEVSGFFSFAIVTICFHLLPGTVTYSCATGSCKLTQTIFLFVAESNSWTLAALFWPGTSQITALLFFFTRLFFLFFFCCLSLHFCSYFFFCSLECGWRGYLCEGTCSWFDISFVSGNVASMVLNNAHCSMRCLFTNNTLFSPSVSHTRPIKIVEFFSPHNVTPRTCVTLDQWNEKWVDLGRLWEPMRSILLI